MYCAHAVLSPVLCTTFNTMFHRSGDVAGGPASIVLPCVIGHVLVWIMPHITFIHIPQNWSESSAQKMGK